jgi:hypothetical protein
MVGDLVRLLLLFLAFAGLLPAQDRARVLLELFTSEGCSSCPPADSLLVKLHQEQPIRGVEVIVLSEHVDYWNRLGWADRFSLPEATRRQNWYSSRWPTRVYTPQAVVDGEREAVGGDGPAIVQLIREAARKPKGQVEISYVLEEGYARLRLNATGFERSEAKVILAIVENGLETSVVEGENAGRTLRHAGVVRALLDAGTIQSGETSWSGAVEPTLDAGWDRENLRAVAFVQEVGSRAVLAIGVRDLAE